MKTYALAQALVAVIALILGKHQAEVSSVPEIMTLNGRKSGGLTRAPSTASVENVDARHAQARARHHAYGSRSGKHRANSATTHASITAYPSARRHCWVWIPFPANPG